MPNSWGTRYHYQTSWGNDVPPTYEGLGGAANVQNYFTVGVDGWIVGVRYYGNLEDGVEHFGLISAESDNSILAIVRFKPRDVEPAGARGWQHAYFSPRLPVQTGVRYNVGVLFPDGGFYYDEDAFDGGATIDSEDIQFGPDSVDHWNGQITFDLLGISFLHSEGVRYGVDILFLASTEV